MKNAARGHVSRGSGENGIVLVPTGATPYDSRPKRAVWLACISRAKFENKQINRVEDRARCRVVSLQSARFGPIRCNRVDRAAIETLSQRDLRVLNNRNNGGTPCEQLLSDKHNAEGVYRSQVIKQMETEETCSRGNSSTFFLRAFLDTFGSPATLSGTAAAAASAIIVLARA